MFRDIVVTLDGSRFAEAALPLAAWLSRASGARMHCVLAHQPRAALIGAGEMVLPPVDLYEELWTQDRAYLEKTIGRVRTGTGGPAEFHLVEGPAGPAICEEVDRLDADLVVMATHGRGAFRRFWLGSVADYLIRHLTTPIILVHPSPERTRRRARPIKGILVALDLSKDAEAILDPVTLLAETTGAELTLAHIVELHVEVVRPDATAPILPDAEFLEASRREAQRRLDGIAARLSERGLTVTTRAVTGVRAAGGLLAMLDEDGYDLIALTTHGRSGARRLLLGSVADKVIRGAAKPVLVLRPVRS